MVVLLIFVILIIFISAVLAVQIANESSLALRVKQFLHLEQPFNKKLLAFGKYKTWVQIIGSAAYIVFPLIFVLIVLLRIHRLISDLLECPYCISFHIMWMLCFFYLGLPIITSLVLAPLAIMGVYILEKIRS